MLECFYEKSREEIKNLLIDFLDVDFYQKFSDLKGVVSIVVTGSVGCGVYDRYSDIDMSIVFPDETLAEKYTTLLREYKIHLKELDLPIQLHTSKAFLQLEARLATWKEDGLLKEISSALIVEDPYHSFRTLQEKYHMYPEDIRREKLKWLFSELVLEIEERWRVAKERNNVYFCEAIKLRVIKLSFTVLLLLDGQYPSYDKHIYKDVKALEGISSQVLSLVDELLHEKDITKTAEFLKSLFSCIESTLLEKGVITKESMDYWLCFRTRYNVVLG